MAKRAIFLLAVGFHLIHPITARECRFNETSTQEFYDVIEDRPVNVTEYFSALYFDSQEKITAKLQGCTSVFNEIRIWSNYTDRVVDLTGITELEMLRTWGFSSKDRNLVVQRVLLPDLQRINNLELPDMQGLVHLSVPRLAHADAIVLNVSSADLVFPVLSTVDDFRIIGLFKSLTAPSLNNVTRLGIYNWDDGSQSSSTAKEIVLPSLEDAVTITVDGVFKSISIPKLQRLREYDSYIYPLLRVRGKSVSVSLPALQNASYINIVNASSIDFSSLNETVELEISASSPANLPFPSLQKADRIRLSGVIHNTSFPMLRHSGPIRIDTTLSTPDFNCTALSAQWQEARGSPPSEPVTCWTYDDPGGANMLKCGSLGQDFSCARERTPKEWEVYRKSLRRKGLTSEQKLGVGLGVGLGCFFLALGLLVVWRWYTKKKDEEKRKKNIVATSSSPSTSIELNDGVTIGNPAGGRSSVDTEATKIATVTERPVAR